MKRNLFTIVLLVLTLALVGCEPTDGERPSGLLGSTHHFTTQKGLDCVFVKKGYGGGLSCNWEKYNKEQSLRNMKERY